MLRINQTFINSEQELDKIENYNHKDAMELIPMSKEKRYDDLVDGEECVFLSIKVSDYNDEVKEAEIINNRAYMAILVCTNRVLRKYNNLFKTVSISFKDSLNKLRSEGLFVNALIIPKDKKLLSTEFLTKLEVEIAVELKIIPAPSGQKENEVTIKNNDKLSVKPVKEDNNEIKNSNNSIDNPSTIIDTGVKANTKINRLDKEKDNKVDKDNYTNQIKETKENNNSLNTSLNGVNPFSNSFNPFSLFANARNHHNMLNNSDKTFKNGEYKRDEKENINNSIISTKSETDVATKTESIIKNTVENEENTKVNIESIESFDDDNDNNKKSDYILDENISESLKVTDKSKTDIKEHNLLDDSPLPLENNEEDDEDKKNENIYNRINNNEDNKKVNNDINEDIKTNIKEDTKKESFSNESIEMQTSQNIERKEDIQETLSDSKNDFDNFDKKFIQSFFNGAYGKNDISEAQEEAYKNSTEDVPFLNAIKDYVPINNIEELEEDTPLYEIYEDDAFVQTSASKAKIQKSFVSVVRYFMESEHTTLKRVLTGEKDENSFMQDIEAYITKYLQIPEEDRPIFSAKIKNALFSYHTLTAAINDPKISDIRVLAPDNINVKVHGKHFKASNLSFIDEADYNRFIESLIIKNKINVNSPILVFTDKDFNPDYILRFNLCLPYINSTNMAYLHIRKVPKKKTTLKDLIKANMLDTKIASYLLDKVISSRGMVFSGPSASGKTTLQNALVDYIPKDKSILCIQESEEMFSNIHPNAYFQHMLKGTHGETLIGLSELGQNGLLCDSGYFIIGECKGAEVRDLLRASNTGHKCWCTVHSQSSTETISRLADYVKYGADYSFDEAVRMLKDLEVIVYIENFKIKEITEIVGYDEDKKQIIYKPIYRRNIQSVTNIA